MKPYTNIICVALALLLLGACTKFENLSDAEEYDLQVSELDVTLASIDAGETSRATSPYGVNTDIDPTKAKMEDRSGWKLEVQIYNDKVVHSPDGEATFIYDTDKWVTSNMLCFPNYTKQMIGATLHPNGWSTSTPFLNDQSNTDKSDLLKQDILKELKSDKLYNPAKKIVIEMKHAYSMLDFIIQHIDYSEIDKVQVFLGGIEYLPCKIKESPIEYMLIVPATTVDAKNPVVQITTTKKEIYKQEVKLIGAKNGNSVIDNYTENTCYCFTLSGMELLLSPIIVSDWATGQAVAGEYIAVTAYPTFRGKPNETFYVYYDNCLKYASGGPKMQRLVFNSRGECTIKPDGRIITHIGVSETLESPTITLGADKVLLSGMIVDLNDIIAKLP